MSEQQIVGPANARETPRHAGPARFARLPCPDEMTRYDVAVARVPFDSDVSYQPGARFGPATVREASRLRVSLLGRT
jgi:guanidinobutyrase / D-arginase